MSKLSLEDFKLGAGVLLQRDQLRTVFGGNSTQEISAGDEKCTSSSCSSSNWCGTGCICKCDDNGCSSGTCVYS